MRCVVVNGAQLKADAVCAHYANRIGENYIREIGSRLIYCEYRCYGIAAELSAAALAYCAPVLSRGTRGS
jgi:hypothetical protein